MFTRTPTLIRLGASLTQGALWGLLAAGLLTACAPNPTPIALHADIARVETAPVDAMTRLVAQREWLSLQESVRQSKLTEPVKACLAQIDPDALAVLAAPVLQTRFSEEDRAVANAFLDTHAGQQMAIALLNTLHGDRDAMMQMQSQMTTPELHAQVQFTQTPLGLLLIGGLDPKTREALQQAFEALFEPCRTPEVA